MIIQRIENFEGTSDTTYLNDNGYFVHDKKEAHQFTDMEKAEEMLDLVMSDPVWDKSFMGKSEFSIIID